MNPQQACSRKDRWGTPPHIIKAARQTLGTLAWDLASEELANHVVGATEFFTQERSFLIRQHKHHWHKNFWCNPPFTKVKAFTDIIVARPDKLGIMLVNASTETQWFQSLANDADALFFPKGRLQFTNIETRVTVTGNPKGQVLIGWGVEFGEHWGDGLRLRK